MQKRPSKHKIVQVKQGKTVIGNKHFVHVTATAKPKVTQSERRVVVQIPGETRKKKKSDGGKKMPKPRARKSPWMPVKKGVTRVTSSGGRVPFKIKPIQIDIDRKPGVNVRVKEYPKKGRHLRI